MVSVNDGLPNGAIIICSKYPVVEDLCKLLVSVLTVLVSLDIGIMGHIPNAHTKTAILLNTEHQVVYALLQLSYLLFVLLRIDIQHLVQI